MVSMTPLDRRSLLGAGALTGIGLLLVGTTSSQSAAAGRYAVQLSDAAWRAKLGPARFQVLRRAGTERPFSSPLLKEKRKGIYACAGCDLPLFSSAAKYDSGTGWPSFWKALPKAIVYERDLTLGIPRVEEICRRCGGHLGHVFDDGPRPTGKRHCVNGLSLVFRAA